MALGTLTSLKLFIDKSDADEDTLLQEILDGVSDRMERWIVQPITVTAYTEEPHMAGPYPEIVLNFGPVTAVSAVDENGTALSASDYRIDDLQSLTRLTNSGTPQLWIGQVLVSYSAGYATLPDSLSHASVTQAAFEYKQSKLGGSILGLSNRSPESGDGVGYVPLEFLPSVIEAMKPFRGLL